MKTYKTLSRDEIISTFNMAFDGHADQGIAKKLNRDRNSVVNVFRFLDRKELFSRLASGEDVSALADEFFVRRAAAKKPRVRAEKVTEVKVLKVDRVLERIENLESNIGALDDKLGAILDLLTAPKVTEKPKVSIFR